MRSTYLLMPAIIAGLTVTGAALAQEADPGQMLYTDYCAACHGASGMGDGTWPMS